MSANTMTNREKRTAHAMFPGKDAGVIAAWPLLAFRDLRLLKLGMCTAPPPGTWQWETGGMERKGRRK